MSQKNHNDDVLMVLNPNNNKLYNVLPLFELNKMSGFEELYESVDDTIRLFSCVIDENLLVYHDVRQKIEDLYFIRDMFRDLMKCEVTLPQSKCK